MSEPSRATNPTTAAVTDAVRELERALARFWVAMETVEATEPEPEGEK